MATAQRGGHLCLPATSRDTFRESPQRHHAGWFAVYEEGIRMIDRSFDRDAAKRKAMAAYVALLRIANLAQNMTFSRSIGQIARDMAYSYNHAAEGLDLLKIAGLVRIEQRQAAASKERAPSVYTLLFPFPRSGGSALSEVPPEKKCGEGAESFQEPLQEHPIPSNNGSSPGSLGEEVKKLQRSIEP